MFKRRTPRAYNNAHVEHHITMLRHGTENNDGISNYVAWRDDLNNYTIVNFKELGNLITTEKYQKFSEYHIIHPLDAEDIEHITSLSVFNNANPQQHEEDIDHEHEDDNENEGDAQQNHNEEENQFPNPLDDHNGHEDQGEFIDIQNQGLQERDIQLLIVKQYLSDKTRYYNNVKEESTKLFGVIWKSLSRVSRDVVESDASFDAIKRKCDALELFLLIKKTHSGYNPDRPMELFKTRRAFDLMKQQPNESISEYHLRYTNMEMLIASMDKTLDVNDQHHIIKFIMSLDDRFTSFKKTMETRLYEKDKKFPQTRKQAYELLRDCSNVSHVRKPFTAGNKKSWGSNI